MQNGGVHDERRANRQEKAQQQAIKKGFMIGNYQQLAMMRRIGFATHFNTKQQTTQHAQQ